MTPYSWPRRKVRPAFRREITRNLKTTCLFWLEARFAFCDWYYYIPVNTLLLKSHNCISKCRDDWGKLSLCGNTNSYNTCHHPAMSANLVFPAPFYRELRSPSTFTNPCFKAEHWNCMLTLPRLPSENSYKSFLVELSNLELSNTEAVVVVATLVSRDVYLACL